MKIFLFLLLFLFPFSVNAQDIITTLQDGRTVVLHNDGTWEVLKSSDTGKIAVSVTSMTTVKDDYGYDACEFSMKVKNLTKYSIEDGAIFFNLIDNKYNNPVGGRALGARGSFNPGDILSATETVKDLNCNDVNHVNSFFYANNRRIIKGKKFNTEKDVEIFINKLIIVSSEHDPSIASIKIYD